MSSDEGFTRQNMLGTTELGCLVISLVTLTHSYQLASVSISTFTDKLVKRGIPSKKTLTSFIGFTQQSYQDKSINMLSLNNVALELSDDTWWEEKGQKEMTCVERIPAVTLVLNSPAYQVNCTVKGRRVAQSVVQRDSEC